MKNLLKLIVLTVFLFSTAMTLSAQNDIKISIQGTLKDANSSAVDDGSYEVIFRLYNTNSGGSAVWEETATVQVAGGVYSHRLGSIEPLDAADFTETLFVGVEVNGVELSPRTELTYAPYTLNTQYAAQAGNGVPSGAMMPFAGPLANVPSDYVPCDGRALKSSDYPNLFAAIGTAWGDGSGGAGAVSGVTDFNVPDSRGMFLRGWNDGSGNDPDASSRTASAAGGNTGDNVGSSQGDALKQHNHTMQSAGQHSHTINNGGDHSHTWNGYYNVTGGTGASQVRSRYNISSDPTDTSSNSNGAHSHTMQDAGNHTHTINNSGGNESRPKNIAVLYIIKK